MDKDKIDTIRTDVAKMHVLHRDTEKDLHISQPLAESTPISEITKHLSIDVNTAINLKSRGKLIQYL